jgi:hypothetical protein
MYVVENGVKSAPDARDAAFLPQGTLSPRRGKGAYMGLGVDGMDALRRAASRHPSMEPPFKARGG